ncbi:actin-related protein 6 [Neocloeon triangulifer]|uniref:actin-related protein 6 n=1 Tax=Neocloeon triangulifer TaxID=2078957 RepID=UPI00286F9B89|nr:actin-related protein 6 [Neocloeon triangulifer]
MTAKNVYVLDNGAFSLKVGLSSETKPKVIPNAIMKAKSERRRLFVGNDIEECRDASGLYYILPFQKGYLVNWDTEKTVWDHAFSKNCCPVSFSDTPLIFTEPLFNFQPLQEGANEIFFEEYDCCNLLRINAVDLSQHKYLSDHPDAKACLVVDCGYSFTHVVPYIMGKRRTDLIRRIEVGGKLLTNHLKDIISYRQLHVMDETYVMNQVKEDACFVAEDLMASMKEAATKGPANTILKEYVLPDFTSIRRGYLRDVQAAQDEGIQLLRLNNERFAVPEILFHPSDVGLQQMGIPELIMHIIGLCEPETQPHLWRNIVLTGGSTLFPGFEKRLTKELRAVAPCEYLVKVTMPSDPLGYAWQGGKALAADPKAIKEKFISKHEYEEHGHVVCAEKFDI